MARKGRPRKTREQKLADALSRTAPPDHILETRKQFSFVQKPADKRLDGRNGEIDSEVCDAIGQLCALGLLDGHGHDPVELRDKGRFWGGQYVALMKTLDAGTASHEMPVDMGPRQAMYVGDGPMTPQRLLFAKMDENLPSYERSVLLSLIVDPLIGSDPVGRAFSPWAQALIDEALLSRGRVVKCMRFPGEQDREYLKAAVRGLCVLVDGALPARWAA